MSSAVVCVAVSGTLKERPSALKSSEATLVEVDCTSVRSLTKRSMPGMPTSEALATESSRSVKLSRPSLTEAKRSETPEALMPDGAGDDRLVIGAQRTADTDEQRSAGDLNQQRRLRAAQAAARDATASRHAPSRRPRRSPRSTDPP